MLVKDRNLTKRDTKPLFGPPQKCKHVCKTERLTPLAPRRQRCERAVQVVRYCGMHDMYNAAKLSCNSLLLVLDIIDKKLTQQPGYSSLFLDTLFPSRVPKGKSEKISTRFHATATWPQGRINGSYYTALSESKLLIIEIPGTA